MMIIIIITWLLLLQKYIFFYYLISFLFFFFLLSWEKCIIFRIVIFTWLQFLYKGSSTPNDALIYDIFLKWSMHKIIILFFLMMMETHSHSYVNQSIFIYMIDYYENIFVLQLHFRNENIFPGPLLLSFAIHTPIIIKEP